MYTNKLKIVFRKSGLQMIVTFSGIYLLLNEEITWKLDIKFSHFA